MKCNASQSLTDNCGGVKKLSHGMCILPAKVEQGIALPPCFSSHTMNRCPSLVCLVLCFGIFVLFIGDFVV